MADMMDLDNILEDDLMDALGDLGSVSTTNDETIILEQSNIEEPMIDDITITEPVIDHNTQTQTQSLNIDNIANLLKELLNNKTIEITIKLKDN